MAWGFIFFQFCVLFFFGKYLGISQLGADPEIVQTPCFTWVPVPNADPATSLWSSHLLHRFGFWQVLAATKESLRATFKCGADVSLRVFRKAVDAKCCIFVMTVFILQWKTVTKRENKNGKKPENPRFLPANNYICQEIKVQIRFCTKSTKQKDLDFKEKSNQDS